MELVRNTERARLRVLVAAADIEPAQAMHGSDLELITPLGAALTRNEYLRTIAAD
ncbi:hypothetical protein [Nocardia fluminea]|uniref:hypothetical protein n=1 Tax=Nocardia fluminea TaxID=134984 RepID=UPI003655E13A